MENSLPLLTLSDIIIDIIFHIYYFLKKIHCTKLVAVVKTSFS